MKQMNLTRRTASVMGLGIMLATASVAMAQAALPPAPPPGAPGAAAGGQASSTANDPGSIDTSQQTTTTTTTTKTKSGSADSKVLVNGKDTKPLPNTGGDPLLFVLAGSMLIGGGWVLRRKMMQSGS